MSGDRPILRYHGGKWKLAPRIIAHFPENPSRYIEPFCGAAGVFFRIPEEKRAPLEVLNDLNWRVVNLFRVLRRPDLFEQLVEQLLLTPYSLEEFQEAYTPSEDPVEDARRMLILGQQGHGSTAASGGKRSGWRRGGPPAGAHAAKLWADMPEIVTRWRTRLCNTYVDCAPWERVLKAYACPGALIYADPPYVHESRREVRPSGPRGYTHEFTDLSEHERLARVLNDTGCNVVLSGYRTEHHDTWYKDWRRVDLAHIADKGTKTTESLWMNF